ncbi:MAG: ATP-binding protein [Acidiferrobacteraceae bacterium]
MEYSQPASVSATNLRRLVLLRTIAIFGQGITISIVYFVLRTPLPVLPMVMVVTIYGILDILVWLRLWCHWPVTYPEFFGHLVTDIGALSALLYFSGGGTNPFIFLYLIPLMIAATTMPRVYTWTIATLTITCYSLLMFYYVPLLDIYQHVRGEFEAHIVAMWLNFAISAVLISWFIVRMSESIRVRDWILAKAREETLRHERIVALGTMAAGTAHSLGTPLATMDVLLGELQHAYADDASLKAGLETLAEQIKSCKKTLACLVPELAGRDETVNPTRRLDDFFSELLGDWQLMRSSINLRWKIDGNEPTPTIVEDRALGQALMNLLNNAADTSPAEVEFSVRWGSDELCVEILDRGEGLSAEALQHAGEPFFTTKPRGQGLGIGLLLANATLERYGGSVRITNRDGGGARTEVRLPMARLVWAQGL